MTNYTYTRTHRHRQRHRRADTDRYRQKDIPDTPTLTQTRKRDWHKGIESVRKQKHREKLTATTTQLWRHYASLCNTARQRKAWEQNISQTFFQEEHHYATNRRKKKLWKLMWWGIDSARRKIIVRGMTKQCHSRLPTHSELNEKKKKKKVKSKQDKKINTAIKNK